MILEVFSLEANSFVIDPFNTVLNDELKGNIFFGFTVNGEVHRWVAIFDLLSRIYSFNHNIFIILHSTSIFQLFAS